jgi:methyl acetate hydrolase
MHQVLDALLAQSELPGVVATVLIDGEVVYDGASGVRKASESTPMTTDTVLAIFSMTKAITAAAAMQLVERGQLKLDVPASSYIEALGDVRVLERFDSDGQPQLRAPRAPVTLRNLLSHTSGFGYELWNADIVASIAALGTPSIFALKKASLNQPLMFDPGTAWEYGIGIDWVGQLVEAASGQTLGAYFDEHVFGPLGMSSTGFTPTASMLERLASLHLRTPDGIVPMELPPPAAPEFEMGGGGLLSTVGDYAKFAQMIADNGRSGANHVLSASTVAEMSRNQLDAVPLRVLKTATPLALDLDMLPGTDKGWGLSFLLNLSETPQGRSAGSLSWAGLASSYYWIDPTKRVVAVWATQLFPFGDPTVIAELEAFESAVYTNLGN